MTPATPPPRAPTLGQSFNLKPVSGVVLVKVPGKGFVPLTEAQQLPNGKQIDALNGAISLVASTGAKHGKTETGTFNGGIFKLAQARAGSSKGLTTLSMLEGAFKGAPTYASCTAHKSADGTGRGAQAALSSKVLQTLHAKAHGKFRTSGKYSAATVRGTVWAISDRCNGTLTTVQTDSVLVQDFVRHLSIIVRAGHSYLAKPPKHK